MDFKGIHFGQNQLCYKLLQGSEKNKSLIDAKFNKNNTASGNSRDSFIRSSLVNAGAYTSAGTYTPTRNKGIISEANPLTVKSKYISQDILEDMNSGKYATYIQGDIVECNGNRFRLDQIPPIDGAGTKEVRQAKNNVMDFGSNSYFKYTSADGREHLLYTSEGGAIGAVTSDDIRMGGAPYDGTLQRYASFWNYMMGKHPEYIGLSFTDEEVKGYLKEAGIKKGFFTIKMSGRETTQFLSESKYSSGVHSKEEYDEQYAALTSTSHLLSEYAPGDVFKVEGKEYVLSESHTLNIPYGEDIYDIEYPKNYSYGKRID